MLGVHDTQWTCTPMPRWPQRKGPSGQQQQRQLKSHAAQTSTAIEPILFSSADASRTFVARRHQRHIVPSLGHYSGPRYRRLIVARCALSGPRIDGSSPTSRSSAVLVMGRTTAWIWREGACAQHSSSQHQVHNRGTSKQISGSRSSHLHLLSLVKL